MTDTSMEYWTIEASLRPVDGDFESAGAYFGDDGKPLFKGINNVDGRDIVRFKTLQEAQVAQGKIAQYWQSELDFNEEIGLYIVRHYYEDEEWCDEVLDEEDMFVSYQFADITGSIIVVWSWETHVGYCRKFHELRIVEEWDSCHDESLLVEEDYVYRPQCSILFSAEEVEKMSEEGTLDVKVEEALKEKIWKWNNLSFLNWYLHQDELKEKLYKNH